MRAAVGLEDGLSLDGDRCIRVIPRQHYNLDMNLNPLSIYICTHCPQVAQRC